MFLTHTLGMKRIKATWNGAIALIRAEDALFLWEYSFYGKRPDSDSRYAEHYGLLLPGEIYHLLKQHEAGTLNDWEFSVQRYDPDEAQVAQSMNAALFLNELVQSGERLTYLRVLAYQCLRQRGWIVQSGLNYGADYIIYKQNPEEEHATHTVIVQGEGEADHKLLWREVVAYCRVAHSARKKLLIAFVNDVDNVRLLELTRFNLQKVSTLTGHEPFTSTMAEFSQCNAEWE